MISFKTFDVVLCIGMPPLVYIYREENLPGISNGVHTKYSSGVAKCGVIFKVFRILITYFVLSIKTWNLDNINALAVVKYMVICYVSSGTYNVCRILLVKLKFN